MPRALLAPLAAAVALLAAPGVAGAAQVISTPRVDNGCHKGFCDVRPPTLKVLADPGEANAVTLGEAGGVYTVRDTGAPLRAGSGCEQIDANTVRCVQPGASVSVGLGDGDDTVSAPLDQKVYLDGGPGADRLDGGPGADSLSGGAGPDVLHGGPGGDSLAPDYDDQDPRASAVADDMVDGGEGRDHLTYSDRAAPLVADLAAGLAGEAGERDTITGVESLTGGTGNDLITGDAGANRLNGWQGDDEVRGGDGDDELDGGAGLDRLDGEAGDDQIEAYDAPAAGRCGDGDDRVLGLGGATLVRPDCEFVGVDPAATAQPLLSARPLRRTARHLVYAVRCPPIATTECRVFVDVRTAGRPRVRLAGSRGRVIDSDATEVAIRLTRAGRRVLRRRCPRLKVTLRGAGTGRGWTIPKRIAAEPGGPPWCRRR